MGLSDLPVIAIWLVVIMLFLFIGFWLLVGVLIVGLGAVYAWPLSLLLAVIGGFFGGGWGALIGAGVSGGIGLLLPYRDTWLTRVLQGR